MTESPSPNLPTSENLSPLGIQITDVTLRDGLQTETKTIPTDQKIRLFKKLVACGYSRLEITGFVNPKWVPQFSDAEQLCKQLFSEPVSCDTMAFVPNEKGLERMLPYPISWAGCFIATSEAFNKKNVNATPEETLSVLATIISRAHREKRRVRVYVSTVFGCPYEGRLSDDVVWSRLKAVAELRPDEIALSDTIGVATPHQTKRVLEKFFTWYPSEKTALHLHNTYGLAVASALAGYECGVRRFDGSTGGVGGCPYAAGATGNVACEDLLFAFFREGYLPEFETHAQQSVWEELSRLGLSTRSRIGDVVTKGSKVFLHREQG